MKRDSFINIRVADPRLPMSREGNRVDSGVFAGMKNVKDKQTGIRCSNERTSHGRRPPHPLPMNEVFVLSSSRRFLLSRSGFDCAPLRFAQNGSRAAEWRGAGEQVR